MRHEHRQVQVVHDLGQPDAARAEYWKGVAERALAKHHDYEEALRISREQTSKILDVVWALHD